MPRIDEFLKYAISNRASDIHFSANEPIRMRVDGDLVPIAENIYTSEELQEILFEILTPQEREKIGTAKNLDKSHIVEGTGFFRVNIFWTRRGIAAVLRTIPKKIPTVDELKLPPACTMLAEAPKGLVLVTGPTGSGKSTTLAAMINHINNKEHLHILTAEDPVEFVHESKKSLINQREIGSSCHTFADALKYALREDPDVILVGEMRDLETIGLALTAAETGHLVFGTLHTRGAGASVDRIIDSFPANQQAMIRTMLSESLVGVISQSLLKRCDRPGRVAAFEIMVVNHAISNLIREGKTFQIPSIIQTGRKEGMILMDQNILEHIDAGVVSVEEAEAYMEDATPLNSRRKKPKPGAAPTATPPTLKAVAGSKPATPPPMSAPAASAPSAPAATAPARPAFKPTVAPVAPPVEPPAAAPVAAVKPQPTPIAEREEILTDLTNGDEAADPNNPFVSTADPGAEDAELITQHLEEIQLEMPSEIVNETPAPIGEDPFAPSQEIDLNELEGLDAASALEMPTSKEFDETKVVERDETATSEVKVPAPAPAKPQPAVPTRAAAPIPTKPAPPVIPTKAPAAAPTPASPVKAAPAAASAAPAAVKAPAAAAPIPGRIPVPPPPGGRNLPPPPPPPTKKAS